MWNIWQVKINTATKMQGNVFASSQGKHVSDQLENAFLKLGECTPNTMMLKRL